MSSDSESSSSSGSDSDSPAPLIQKPIFISSRKKGKQNHAATESKSHDIAIQKLDHQLQMRASEVEIDFDGTIDTDNLDVEGEFRDWQARERERKKSERAALEKMEQEKNDKIRRTHLPGSEVKTENSETSIQSKLGVFHSNTEGMEKFLKREYADVEDSGDHSRPTRFKK
ncbi:hypothetical protein CLIB1423_06S06414 [[Candida] railenensis]|uniref:Micro-fibrillar-associated protein 1 C-terminal domain-containing protein n=1 Tax=[Candida] railenensis TaxID=45579 RepID=A0A9P0QPX1_9ASCO|nr:hypothetical protein CLIB1423_06S06414 [[Candida] railenensis]